jgi:hypothetical protein
MRKEKRGHARGTDDRGRAGTRGRPHDGDATGRRGQWKRKRYGWLCGKRGLRDVGTAENQRVDFGSSSGGKGLKKF